jgi:hypothetical protein
MLVLSEIIREYNASFEDSLQRFVIRKFPMRVALSKLWPVGFLSPTLIVGLTTGSSSYMYNYTLQSTSDHIVHYDSTLYTLQGHGGLF